MLTTPITPVPVYPRMATRLAIRSITLGPPPSYYYELQAVDVISPVAEQIDPTTGEVIAAAVPAGEEVTVLKNGNVDMTEAQWKAWPADADDENVQLDAIAANLGLTRV